MPVEFIGMISTRDQSEIRRSAGPVVDRDYVRRFSRAHEDAGFDRVLIGYSSSQPDGLQVAAYAAAHTERLGFLVAHRPGFVAPTLAARTLATLDQFTGGRAAVHIITGGSDGEQRRDGDYLAKDERYDRTDEYLDLAEAGLDLGRRRSATTAGTTRSRTPTPRSARRRSRGSRCTSAAPRTRPTGSAASRPTCSRCGASRWRRRPSRSPRCGPPRPRPAAPSRRGSACRSGPSSGRPRSWPGSGRTRSWTRPRRTSARSAASGGGRRAAWAGPSRRTAGSQRLLAAAAKGELHDRALWTPLAAATGAAGNSTALVGTPETVAAALLDYVDIGVTTILIRGYDPYDDAIDYGRQLLPLVREEVARRDEKDRSRRSEDADHGQPADQAGRGHHAARAARASPTGGSTRRSPGTPASTSTGTSSRPGWPRRPSST